MGFPFFPLISLLVLNTIAPLVEGCSSRSTPKPRPVSTPRPNVTFHTYPCPPNFTTWYCLNGGTCFTINVGETPLYNCECGDDYMGQRCEFKALDRSYLPDRHRIKYETASIASGATVAVFLVVVILFFVYMRYKKKSKQKSVECSEVDIGGGDLERRQPFTKRQPYSAIHLPTTHLPGVDRGGRGDTLTPQVYASHYPLSS